MRCKVGTPAIGGMVEGGWSVKFHSCVDICMMREVVGCKHGGRG